MPEVGPLRVSEIRVHAVSVEHPVTLHGMETGIGLGLVQVQCWVVLGSARQLVPTERTAAGMPAQGIDGTCCLPRAAFVFAAARGGGGSANAAARKPATAGASTPSPCASDRSVRKSASSRNATQRASRPSRPARPTCADRHFVICLVSGSISGLPRHADTAAQKRARRCAERCGMGDSLRHGAICGG